MVKCIFTAGKPVTFPKPLYANVSSQRVALPLTDLMSYLNSTPRYPLILIRLCIKLTALPALRYRSHMDNTETKRLPRGYGGHIADTQSARRFTPELHCPGIASSKLDLAACGSLCA